MNNDDKIMQSEIMIFKESSLESIFLIFNAF